MDPGGDIRWNQGLTRNDLIGWFGDNPSSPGGGDKMFWALSKMPKVARKDEPLSGYYNRLLPIKFVLRMLAILNFNDDEWDTEEGFSDESEGPELDFKDFREKVCKTAVFAGLTLERYDKTNKFERGEGVSVGFPTESVKSQLHLLSLSLSVLKGRVSFLAPFSRWVLQIFQHSKYLACQNFPLIRLSLPKRDFISRCWAIL